MKERKEQTTIAGKRWEKKNIEKLQGYSNFQAVLSGLEFCKSMAPEVATGRAAVEVLEVIEGEAWNVLGVASGIHTIPCCRLVRVTLDFVLSS